MKQLFLFIVALSCTVSLIGCASEDIEFIKDIGAAIGRVTG